MKRKSTIAASAATLIAVGVFAGVSLAGGSQDPTREPAKVLKATTAVATPPGAARAAAKARGKSRKPTVQYFYASQKSVPAEGSGVVTALKCPRGKGEPIAGGARTDTGIVVSYLSRVKPGSIPRTPARTYYVGVDDTSTTNSAVAGATVEIQCAKNITVKHG